jgi:hypothetical protein
MTPLAQSYRIWNSPIYVGFSNWAFCFFVAFLFCKRRNSFFCIRIEMKKARPFIYNGIIENLDISIKEDRWKKNTVSIFCQIHLFPGFVQERRYEKPLGLFKGKPTEEIERILFEIFFKTPSKTQQKSYEKLMQSIDIAFGIADDGRNSK